MQAHHLTVHALLPAYGQCLAKHKRAEQPRAKSGEAPGSPIFIFFSLIVSLHRFPLIGK